MEESKSIFTSKTFYGAVLMLLAQVLPSIFGFLGLPTDEAAIAGYADKAVLVAGFALALYGRWKASHTVHLVAPKPNS